LDNGEAANIRNQVQSLVKQGADKIVLDLRGVATGSLDEGVAVANLFIRNGELAKVVGKDSAVKKTFTAEPSKGVFDGKLAVLIDLGTAGAGSGCGGCARPETRRSCRRTKFRCRNRSAALYAACLVTVFWLTTAKWASPRAFRSLGEERSSTGIKPSVEVKRPETPDPIEVDELIDQQDNQTQNPQPTPTPAAKPKTDAKPAEDIQLKKAIEILQDKSQAAKVG
jgi:carboxyl-terminal processing protease